MKSRNSSSKVLHIKSGSDLKLVEKSDLVVVGNNNSKGKVYQINYHSDKTAKDIVTVSKNGDRGIVLRQYFFTPDNGVVCSQHLEDNFSRVSNPNLYKRYSCFLGLE